MTDVLDAGECVRYSRHFNLKEIGVKGQEKLKQSSVLIVGAGGLGSPLAMYLTCAGIGHLGIIDFDNVEISNLQRQILYTSDDIGKPKPEIAQKRLNQMNPRVKITTYHTPLTSENAEEIIANYHMVIDGTDNFATRYLVNDICVFQKKPNVYGSIFRFDGQVSFFYAEQGPCYRCLYPTPPKPGQIPSCAEGGVLGVLPGIVGSLQATEAIKWITGAGENLIGKLLIFDALEMSFHKFELEKSKDCPVCCANPTITTPIDYQIFCGAHAMTNQNTTEISPQEVKKKIDNGENFILLDIREQWECKIASIEQAIKIRMDNVPRQLDQLDKSKEIVVMCKAGGRSALITEYLRKQGYHSKNMQGGILAWKETVDPDMSAY